MTLIEILKSGITFIYSLDNTYLPKVVITLIMLYLFNRLKRRYIIKVDKLYESAKDKYKYSQYLNLLHIIAITVGLIIIWNSILPNILSFLGLFTAALTVSLKDVIVNIIGGVYILTTSLFSVGDRVILGDIKGDVVAINLSRFTLLEVDNNYNCGQSTGKLVDVPNSLIFSHMLINSTKGFNYIWHEMSISLNKGYKLDTVKRLLYRILEECTPDVDYEINKQIDNVNMEYLIYFNNVKPIVYITIEGDNIIYTMRFLVKPKNVRAVESNINEKLLTLDKSINIVI
ncbi:Mechanosensitive ion channel [compost metagenome]